MRTPSSWRLRRSLGVCRVRKQTKTPAGSRTAAPTQAGGRRRLVRHLSRPRPGLCRSPKTEQSLGLERLSSSPALRWTFTVPQTTTLPRSGRLPERAPLFPDREKKMESFSLLCGPDGQKAPSNPSFFSSHSLFALSLSLSLSRYFASLPESEALLPGGAEAERCV